MCSYLWFYIDVILLFTVIFRYSSPVANILNPVQFYDFDMGSTAKSMLCGSLVTTAWHVIRLRMDKTPYKYGG
jgi:hypothetical protein